mmetsp:Transcript_12856/g.25712  ORF Transcript_12856/g.25712 Transcript_12856/m.25712 type:complete len:462 (-) Transcript_12856:106-1491(-)
MPPISFHGPTRPRQTGSIIRLYSFSLIIIFVIAISLYVALMTFFISATHQNLPTSGVVLNRSPLLVEQEPKPVVQEPESVVQEPEPVKNFSAKGYDYWRSEAVRLASLPAAETLSELERLDPFGTRRFEKKLLEAEISRGGSLPPAELSVLFSCPDPSHRITLPDRRKSSGAARFRSGEDGTFLFFQHLRKAGGTNFCSLAEANLEKSAIPKYYCMPDMKWSGNTRAGYLHSWSNEEISRRMVESGFRIAGNEWENFDPSRHFDLDAVFATSFRKPLHRALSQFRFECVEDRGCRFKIIEQWWPRRADLIDIYTTTFSDHKLGGWKGAVEGNDESGSRHRAEAVGAALDTVSQLDLVLVMEWLAYASPLVRSVLGFDDVTALTTRVRPHVAQAKREDGQEKNVLGAAGIRKASWDPLEYLGAKTYKVMSEHLALDEILTDCARRMFLERLICGDDEGGNVS